MPLRALRLVSGALKACHWSFAHYVRVIEVALAPVPFLFTLHFPVRCGFDESNPVDKELKSGYIITKCNKNEENYFFINIMYMVALKLMAF